VPDLQGAALQEFGVDLGRPWGIGEADADTWGAAWIIARDDRRFGLKWLRAGRPPDGFAVFGIINTCILGIFARTIRTRHS